MPLCCFLNTAWCNAVYSQLSSTITAVFFPPTNPTASTLGYWMVFAIGAGHTHMHKQPNQSGTVTCLLFITCLSILQPCGAVQILSLGITSRCSSCADRSAFAGFIARPVGSILFGKRWRLGCGLCPCCLHPVWQICMASLHAIVCATAADPFMRCKVLHFSNHRLQSPLSCLPPLETPS